MHDKTLPVGTVRMILLSAKTLCRKQNHRDSLSKKTFFTDGSPGKKSEIMDSLGESQI